MKLAVTGPRGRLAQEFMRRYGATPLDCDLADAEALAKALQEVAPDAILHAAAFTDTDGAEKDFDAAIRANVRGTGNLRIAFDGYIVYMSTSYVFDGAKTKPYTENDEPSPLGNYAWSKYGGEQAIDTFDLNHPERHAIIRTVSLYGSKGKDDFVDKVRRKFETGQTFELPDQLVSNPTYIPHLCIALADVISHRVEGILNLVGRDAVSRYMWGIEIAKVFKYNSRLLKPTAFYDPSRGAPRPKNAALDVSKARTLKLPIFTLRQGLEDLKRASS